jgi:hypothetical protein
VSIDPDALPSGEIGYVQPDIAERTRSRENSSKQVCPRARPRAAERADGREGDRAGRPAGLVASDAWLLCDGQQRLFGECRRIPFVNFADPFKGGFLKPGPRFAIERLYRGPSTTRK